MDCQRGDDAGGDVGQCGGHALVAARVDRPQHTCGQTDTAQQRDRCNGGAALLEDHRQLDGTEFRGGIGRRQFCPPQIDDGLPQGAPAFWVVDGLAGGIGWTLGAQDAAHRVAQRQLLRSQTNIHKTPNIIKIVN